MTKPDTKTLIAIAVACLAGVLGTLLMHSLISDERPAQLSSVLATDATDSMIDKEFYDKFFDDDFFKRSRDPFQEMERMNKRLRERFYQIPEMKAPFSGSLFDRSFDEWFSSQFGDGTAGSVRQEEDEDYIYYHLELGDSTVNEANLTVEDDYVEIYARIEQKSDNSNSLSSSVSEARQRFPVPAGVDPASATVTNEENRITIRFSKIF